MDADLGFWWGFAAGLMLMGIFWFYSVAAREESLVLSARAGLPEKLSDGEFYYLIPEGRWTNAQWEDQ